MNDDDTPEKEPVIDLLSSFAFKASTGTTIKLDSDYAIDGWGRDLTKLMQEFSKQINAKLALLNNQHPGMRLHKIELRVMQLDKSKAPELYAMLTAAG
jgi:hypothetical protein